MRRRRRPGPASGIGPSTPHWHPVRRGDSDAHALYDTAPNAAVYGVPADAHSGLVSGMCHVPSSVGSDKWATVGRDGCLKIWQGKVGGWRLAAGGLRQHSALHGPVCRSQFHKARDCRRPPPRRCPPLPAPQSLQPVKTLQVINAPATCVSHLQHAHALVVGSHSRRLRLFDATTFEPCGTITKVGTPSQPSLGVCQGRSAWRTGQPRRRSPLLLSSAAASCTARPLTPPGPGCRWRTRRCA